VARQDVRFSIVVPARNAIRWAPAVVQNLRLQTHGGWEAVVVDDGSDDGTATAILREAAGDERFRVLVQPPSGVSAARNAGIEAARHDWLLFLDADDKVDPGMLDRVAAAISRRPEVELVRCGWASETEQGEIGVEVDAQLDEQGLDLFDACASHCPVAPCAMVVRRSVVEEVGRFDTGLVVAEDWDLWQRIGRRGTVTEVVPAVLAYYRLTPGSAMRRDFARMCADSRVVAERAHRADPRVPRPLAAHARGAPAAQLPAVLDQLVLWTAATACGVGASSDDVLRAFPPVGRPTPDDAAAALFGGAPTAAGVLHRQWPDLWPRLEPSVGRTVRAMAHWLGEPGSGPDIAAALERLVIAHSPVPAGRAIGASQAVDVDLADRPAPFATPEGVIRVVMRVGHGGSELGVATAVVHGSTVEIDEARRAVAGQLALPLARRALRGPATTSALARWLGPRQVTRVVVGAVGSSLTRAWLRARARLRARGGTRS
jgi:hypothetical protein